MNIIYLTTEAVPLAKTGGLADVCGALPSRVAELGHRTGIIMPAFRSVHQSGLPIEATDISFAISLSPNRLVGCRLLKTTIPDGNVPVWLIDQPVYFDRDSLYGTPAGDFPDNGERFVFFCRAAMIAIERIGWSVDIVHCNDWQTGLVPALMKINADQYSWIRPSKAVGAGLLASAGRPSPTSSSSGSSPTNQHVSDQPSKWGTRSVMTIHNLAYQGHFPKTLYPMIGVDWHHFHLEAFEYFDEVNFLKTGIVSADMITTVSPRYSQEIRTPQQGCGLDGVLRHASDRVTGIINGIDTNVWNPETDPHLFQNYNTEDWQEGKAANKLALQKRFGLLPSKDVPMIGLVGRLATQKGWDFILPVLRRHVEESRPSQWIVLGSGEAPFEKALKQLELEFPGKFALHVGFSDALAHQIEAASDVFVMPSHYEPCGLNQLYSLRYGTIPVVTPTGGLADTVVDCTEETLAMGTATGFHLRENSPKGLDDAIGHALHLRYHNNSAWSQMVLSGMQQDWSWGKSAKEYVNLYERTRSLKSN
ncbi:glycogen synthase [Rubripirellula amarantea]|uniref:Glycogen synthase n=1 Tax=Rubripirellula amarantea TaxID=2527999 RepID=A0A5C5WT97_9BACT|nr:glycogen synthase [Rubripirellula amarantea]MDA8744960.1 glycogen synthase [Rubripirellula amarantea]TWT53381.1 Glycogen synthase [Rubripirellula amarantea]